MNAITNLVCITNDRNDVCEFASIGAAFAAAELLSGVTEVARIGSDNLVIETFYFIDGVYIAAVKGGEKWGAELTAAIDAAAC